MNVRYSEKACKRDLKKHGIQPFVSNKDLPMTQQRCVVSITTPYLVSVVRYNNLVLQCQTENYGDKSMLPFRQKEKS